MDFFQPYVEEWDVPPVVDEDQWAALAVARGHILRLTIKQGAVKLPRRSVASIERLISCSHGCPLLYPIRRLLDLRLVQGSRHF